jgi:transcriptional regulator with XRE-family HTH domain
MKLVNWLRGKGYTYKTFAKALGTSPRNVERWARGERLPRWKEADKIFIFTDNDVTGHDLYEQQIQRNQTKV